MRNIVALGLILFLSINSFGQKLSLTDLQNISNKTNWEYVNQYLMNKGWEYYDSEKGSSTKYNTITWSYNKSSYNDEANAWFYLYTFEGHPNKINYSVFNKPSYTIIQKSLSANGYKLSDSEIEDNEIISTYTNSKFILKITTQKRDKDDYSYRNESITGYKFLLIKKSGIYDPDNGKKTDYYYGDVKQAEYTLKNGKLNGKLISYYSNGQTKKIGTFLNGNENGAFNEYSENGNLEFEYSMKNGEYNGSFKTYFDNGKLKKSGSFINGKKNGKFVEYDEQGNKTAEYSMSNDLTNGLLTIYENGKISHSTNHKNDEKNGQYIEYIYNDDGELFLKQYGQYLNDQKNGTWKLYIIEEGKERLLTYTNYKESIKDGLFQDVKGDSLIIGNYQNDKLNGSYKVYRDISKTLFGGVIRSDTTNLTLTNVGRYYNNEKSGYWKNYDLTGALRSDGRYSNGEESGEWQYYYTKWSDKDGGQLPYSEKLFLIQNFSKGALDGKVTRYSYLNEEKYPCSELDENKNPLDTCSRYVYQKVLETTFYKNDKLNGPFELKDSINQTIAKGMFINDLKDGEWFHRYTQKDYEEKDYFIYQEGSYSKGEREGKWIQYYKKGKISKTFYYKQGELHGKYIEWNNLNKPREEKQFSNGKFKELIVYDSLGIKPVNKYEIYAEKYNSYKCRRTQYLTDGYSSQEYWINKEKEIDHNWFEITFLIAIDKKLSDGTKAYKDGSFTLFNSSDQPIVLGKFFKEDRAGLWTNYFYDQQVKIESNYENDLQMDEKYLTLNGGLFTGEFVFTNKDENIKEVRKVKDGLRNGKTIFIDLSTGKTIKKESYKKGVLK